MPLGKSLRTLKRRVRVMKFRIENPRKEVYACPVCGYRGPFEDIAPATGFRRHAKCPSCDALERHRIQYVVMEDLLRGIDARQLKLLHFAPEEFFRGIFAQRFGCYETADLNMQDVDHRVDIQDLPFEDGTYDFVVASHVLEHVPDDMKAIREIRRVLTSTGIAILPVPLIAERTVEYPAPNPNEAHHVRAPGLDYYDRYERVFSRVVKFSSESLPEEYQLFVYEDRSRWPTAECPLRPPMPGQRHVDIVPVCFV